MQLILQDCFMFGSTKGVFLCSLFLTIKAMKRYFKTCLFSYTHNTIKRWSKDLSISIKGFNWKAARLKCTMKVSMYTIFLFCIYAIHIISIILHTKVNLGDMRPFSRYSSWPLHFYSEDVFAQTVVFIVACMSDW